MARDNPEFDATFGAVKEAAVDSSGRQVGRKAYKTPTLVRIDTQRTSNAANTLSDGTGNLLS